MPQHLRLISHKLCPFVQRAVIVAKEKEIPLERVDIDLANKPDWFLAISPTGKVPLLEVTDHDGSQRILFESSVIAEYLDEIAGQSLFPRQPLERAHQRAWVEFASATTGSIGSLYSADDEGAFAAAAAALEKRFEDLEGVIAGPWFAGSRFGLVDAAIAPAFRCLDVFNSQLGRELVARPAKVRAWALSLAARSSVREAVGTDYPEALLALVTAKTSHLARLLERHALEAA